MKHKAFRSCLCTIALAFLLGFGGTACMVTGLRLPADLDWLAIGCFLGALVPAVCLCFHRGELILSGIAGAFTLLMVFSQRFQEQLQALCYSAMTYYHKGYGIPIPSQINGCTADSQLLPLLFIAGLVMTATVWVIMRRTPAFPAVILAVLPLGSCLVVTDTVPDALPIYLLVLGLLLLLLTQPVRRQNRTQAIRLTAFLALPTAAALALLFFLVPRDSYSFPNQTSSPQDLLQWFMDRIPMLDQTSDGELVISFGPVTRDQVDLSEIGNRTERNTPVMEVNTDYTGTVYLRGQDFDVYTGLGWNTTLDRTENDYCLSSLIWYAPTQNISIRTFGRGGVYYLPCYPAEAQTLSGGKVPNPTNTTTYSYSFAPLRSDWESIWERYDNGSAFPPSIPAADERYLQLPDKTRQLAQLYLHRAGLYSSGNAIDNAQAIVSHVRTSAAYDLNPGQMPGSEIDFAMWFLEDSDTGYCVHFATAATVLLRAAGIPARYVEGYTVSTQAGQATVVREKSAHAWVEYYLDYVGWVILDPTPGIAEPPVESTENTTAPTQPDETKPTETEPTVTEPKPTTPSEETQPSTNAPADPSDPPTQGGIGTGSTAQGSSPQWFLTLLAVIFYAAAAAFLITGQWYLRRWLMLKQLVRGRSNQQALARYRSAVRLSKACHIPVPDHLRKLAEKAKFSQYQLTGEELKQFDSFRQDCVKTLKKRPWYCRLIYQLVLALY